MQITHFKTDKLSHFTKDRLEHFRNNRLGHFKSYRLELFFFFCIHLSGEITTLKQIHLLRNVLRNLSDANTVYTVLNVIYNL